MWLHGWRPDLGHRLAPESRWDAGGIVLGWLLRITLALIIMGIFVFDVFSLAYTNVTTVDDAQIVAGVGAEHLIEDPNDSDAAIRASSDQASELGVHMRRKDWWIDEEGEVHVTVSRTAETLVLRLVKPLQRYLTVHAVGTAQSN